MPRSLTVVRREPDAPADVLEGEAEVKARNANVVEGADARPARFIRVGIGRPHIQLLREGEPRLVWLEPDMVGHQRAVEGRRQPGEPLRIAHRVGGDDPAQRPHARGNDGTHRCGTAPAFVYAAQHLGAARFICHGSIVVAAAAQQEVAKAGQLEEAAALVVVVVGGASIGRRVLRRFRHRDAHRHRSVGHRGSVRFVHWREARCSTLKVQILVPVAERAPEKTSRECHGRRR
eukprot:4881569-Prymnesium_polylepis.2